MSGPGSTPAVRGQLHALPAEREVPAGAGRRPGVEQPPGLLPHHPRHARALGQGAARQVATPHVPGHVSRATCRSVSCSGDADQTTCNLNCIQNYAAVEEQKYT